MATEIDVFSYDWKRKTQLKTVSTPPRTASPKVREGEAVAARPAAGGDVRAQRQGAEQDAEEDAEGRGARLDDEDA
ncbi:hypothetical protein [Streptomyces sp. NWU339]|uniref:hypothetical protein n=1 Tax=Streptomyces sp. NWU339 TaxID=2185284 RepID=UPI0015E810B3|nr:hypothetical protein [Streptomyces sp. NWU339]